MESHYQVEGDMVMAHITFVLSEHSEDVTCEASNEAPGEPIRTTVVLQSNSDSATSTRVDEETGYEYDYSDDSEENMLGQNLTYSDRLSADGTIESEMANHEISESNSFESPAEDDMGASAYSAGLKTENVKTNLGITDNYLEDEITESDHSEAYSATVTSLKNETFVNRSDSKQDYPETPTDAVFVPAQKHLSNTQSIKTGVEVTDTTKAKEEGKKVNLKPSQASHTMNSAYGRDSNLSLFLIPCLVVILTIVTRS